MSHVEGGGTGGSLMKEELQFDFLKNSSDWKDV